MGNASLSQKSNTNHNHPTQLTLENRACQNYKEILDLLANPALLQHCSFSSSINTQLNKQKKKKIYLHEVYRVVSLTPVFWMNIDLKWVVFLLENWSVFTLAFTLRVWWSGDWLGVSLWILSKKNSTCGKKDWDLHICPMIVGNCWRGERIMWCSAQCLLIISSSVWYISKV